MARQRSGLSTSGPASPHMPRPKRLYGVLNGYQSLEGTKALQLLGRTGAYLSIAKLQACKDAICGFYADMALISAVTVTTLLRSKSTQDHDS